MSGTQPEGSNTEGQGPGLGQGQGVHRQGSSSRHREPHPVHPSSSSSQTLASHPDSLDHGLHDGLQLQPRPEHSPDHKTNPTSSLANHREDLRHRLEAGAQRALSPSDLVAPAAPAAPASTTARAHGSHGTAGERAVAATGTATSGLAPPETDVDFPEPSPFSLEAPSHSQEHSGIWRSQNPFEAQHPPRSTSPHVSLPLSPHHLPDNQRSAEPEPLPSSEENPEGIATRADRSSIPFEGHIHADLPPQHHHHLTSIRPFAHAIMAFEKARKFSTGTSVHRRRKMSTLVEKEGAFGPALTVCSCLIPHLPRQYLASKLRALC